MSIIPMEVRNMRPSKSLIGPIWGPTIFAAMLLLLIGCTSDDTTPTPTPTQAAVMPTPTQAAVMPTPTQAAVISVPSTSLIDIPTSIIREFPLLALHHWSQVDWSEPSITEVGRTYGGTMRLNQPNSPRTWDTGSTFSSQIVSGSAGFYNRLLTYDLSLKSAFAGKNNYHELVFKSDLADSWDISSDGKTYTFHLNENIRWQNVPPVNGREFTSEDVVYNVERFMDPQTGKTAAIYKEVESIEATDKYTVVFKMKTVHAGFLNALSGPLNGMVPREAVENDAIKNNPIGTGPFTSVDYEPEDHHFAEANRDYFKDGLPYLDRIEWFRIPDANARIAAFRAGRIDEITYTGWSVAKDLFRNCGDLGCDVYVNEQNTTGVKALGFRVDRPPFDNPKVRDAISHAIDWDATISALYEGNGRIGFGAVPTDWDRGRKFPRTQLDAPPNYTYDPDLARTLLSEAGYAPGALSFVITYGTRGSGGSDPAATEATIYQQYLNAVGFDVTLNPLDRTTALTMQAQGDWPTGLYYPYGTGSGSDLDDWVTYFETGSPNNVFGVSDPFLDDLIQRQRVELDRPRREELGGQIADYVYKNNLGRIWTAQPLFYHFTRPWLQGFTGHDIYNWASYFGLNVVEDVWMDASKVPAGHNVPNIGRANP